MQLTLQNKEFTSGGCVPQTNMVIPMCRGSSRPRDVRKNNTKERTIVHLACRPGSFSYAIASVHSPLPSASLRYKPVGSALLSFLIRNRKTTHRKLFNTLFTPQPTNQIQNHGRRFHSRCPMLRAEEHQRLHPRCPVLCPEEHQRFHPRSSVQHPVNHSGDSTELHGLDSYRSKRVPV